MPTPKDAPASDLKVTIDARLLTRIADDVAQLLGDYAQVTQRHHVPGHRAWTDLQLSLTDAGVRGIYDGQLPKPTPTKRSQS